jgi:hypothetical protein
MVVAIPTAAMIEPFRPNISAALSERLFGINRRPIELIAKQIDAAGAIRPGLESLTVIYDGPKSSSIPTFTRKTYSTIVRTLRMPTIAVEMMTNQRDRF